MSWVLIGSARIDENGNIGGGVLGDQNGKECCIESWYLHSDGWVIIRAKDSVKRNKIADDMEYICNNDLIGYDQYKNMTLFDEAKKFGFDARKVDKPCATDCAKAVLVCVRYSGIECDVFYTGNEIDVLSKTGEFDIITEESVACSDRFLERGDILCTPIKGHTVVVVRTDGFMKTFYYTDSKTVDRYKVTAYALNLRLNPDTDSEVICTMSENDNVYALGICALTKDRVWLYVKYKDNYGFASTRYLERFPYEED